MKDTKNDSEEGDKVNRKFSSCSSFDDGEGEDLDPRVQNELEELNAATDGINHLETELSEAQLQFDQSVEDSKEQLKKLHDKLGKCVDKARPYYECLKHAKNARTDLHNVSLRYELAQTRHFNAKKEVIDVEKKVNESLDGKLAPELQEQLNQVTTEVMDSALALADAEKEHNAVNKEFNEKHAQLQQTYNKLKNDVTRSRAFFELKSDLNKKLEQQKQRVVKIEEGISVSKGAYQNTLRNLQLLSEDIHHTRSLRRKGESGVSVSSNNSSIAENPKSTTASSESATVTRQPSLASSELSMGSDDNATWKPGLDVNDTISINSKDEFNLDRCISVGSNTAESDQSKTESGDGRDSRSSSCTSRQVEGNTSPSVRESTGNKAGLVIEVTDAMKNMQGDVKSPFECITSHSLGYSVPRSPEDQLGVDKAL